MLSKLEAYVLVTILEEYSKFVDFEVGEKEIVLELIEKLKNDCIN